MLDIRNNTDVGKLGHLELKKLLTYLLLFFGSIIAPTGAVFVFMYFWEAIILRIGDHDQSLIFWYLPVLFIGFTGIIGGVAMLIQGINRLKNSQ